MTEENKTKIKDTAVEHFKAFPVLEVVDADLNSKVEIIYNELPNIYKKLKDQTLLPEEITLDVFMKITVSVLQNEAQMAHVRSVFGI